jgi:hypothetical protein
MRTAKPKFLRMNDKQVMQSDSRFCCDVFATHCLVGHGVPEFCFARRAAEARKFLHMATRFDRSERPNA